MVFPTVEFAVFFPPVLALSWALMSRPRLWKPFILAASYLFYAAANPKFCLLIAGVTLGNQLAATLTVRAESERAKTLITAGAVVLDLGVLASSSTTASSSRTSRTSSTPRTSASGCR